MSSAPQGNARRPLGPTELVTQLAQHPGWTLQGDGADLAIARRYEFASYAEVMAFANAVAWIAQGRDHHPDMQLGYRHCTVAWRTHDAGGITRIDFECAAQIDALRGSV
ncbi:4a-hydroxytetrahydrobiopterin dehydratase [Rhodoferax sp. BAB1]|uniref:4a-hydroxytetrahydrobiopterin dehydratase n=1 Tax=Rhodoferax sp. BAB1 TaxID=2741720 RepID=UPI0015776125|nr:4a-hydroxytetrahydrobiopterin dehydratase [Rhodoferax sp. BAB1]QKO21050.1 4a-hydroxytetrahydrobiopterin dehydratase [Rhodoferax sp. BAB1]